MKYIFKYRGKNYTQKDIDFINQLIKQNPDDSRYALSKKLCQLWGWIQPNGALRDMVCRSFMLELHRDCLIKLPPKRSSPINYLANRKTPEHITIDQTPLSGKLAEIKPVSIFQVRRTDKEILCNSLIEQFHYLAYCQPVGEHLKYIVLANDRPIACFTWSSAPRHIGCRDKYIGWTANERKSNIHLIAYNSRFLILPWINVKFLASYLLSQLAKRISDDWSKLYNHPVYFLETFVDTEKFIGTSYQAANWIYLGKTTGRGKNDQTNKVNRSIKSVYGYPLISNFQKKLCE
jgi:hypothetical protein